MVPSSCSVERNVKKIRESLSKRQTGHCAAGKVALVPCLVPHPPSGWPKWPWAAQQSGDCGLTPGLPNFYLANKLKVLLLMFGINTWLESLKIWLGLPIKERNVSCATSVLGTRIGFPLDLLSASAPDRSLWKREAGAAIFQGMFCILVLLQWTDSYRDFAILFTLTYSHSHFCMAYCVQKRCSGSFPLGI